MRNQRDPASWAAARAVGAASQQSVSRLAQASTAQEVEQCISTALHLFSMNSSLFNDYVTQPDAGAAQSQAGEDVQQQLVQQLQPHAAVVGGPALCTIFYDDQFDTWACAVLSVAAGEWLPKLQGAERQSLQTLISDTFMQCPAWHALSALLGHLSAVTPHPSSSSIFPSVTAVAADSAAQLLVQRFLAPDSTGLSELLLSCDSSSSSSSSRPPGPAQQQHQQCAQAAADEQHKAACQQQLLQAAPLTAERMQEAAALLAALPDRLQQLQSAAPQLPSAADAVSALLHGCIQHTAADAAVPADTAVGDGLSGAVSTSNSSGDVRPAAAAGAVQLTALLLQKLVTRGHGSAAARVLLDLAVQGNAHTAPSHGPGAVTASSSSSRSVPCPKSQQGQQSAACGSGAAQQWYPAALQQVLLLLLSQQPGTAAAEKLVVRLLRMASATQQQQQQQQQQAVVSFLGPSLSLSDQLRSMIMQKLLLTRTVPVSTLQLLLLLLPACQPSLLPEAAAVLAKAWSDSSMIVQLPVSQQAFMTAALVSCIHQIPREFLDPSTSAHAAADAAGRDSAAAAAAAAAVLSATAAQLGVQLNPYQGLAPTKASTLLSCIIQGVSARLASPSPAIRLQAMRVGRAFAEKLDPTKPMFEDAGPLDLMPEENWPGAVAEQNLAQGVGLCQQQQQQVEKQRAVASSSSSSSSRRTVQALARLAEATEGSDSDDEEALLPGFAAAAAAGANGTASHKPTAAAAAAAAVGSDDGWESGSVADSEGSASSLVAFDLQEDLSAEQWWGPDGLGAVDSKGLGLRALSAALRKQDDVAGALEALKKVEVLIRAEPDELPVVAPELARSLIHCKVPIWASPPAAAAAATAAAGHSQSSSASSTAEQQAHVPKGVSSSAEVQRQRALAAVLSVNPLTAGDTVIAELYSPNLDQYQRMLILDGLTAAAAEMADPRKAPQLALQGPQKAPELLAPAAAAAAAAAGGGGRAKLGAGTALKAGFLQPRKALKSDATNETSSGSSADGPTSTSANGTSSGGSSSTVGSTESSSGKAQAAPGLVETSSRVWGKVSLQKQAQATANNSSSSSSRTFRNRFAPVALRWTAALLQQCDVKQQGIDLFGRDSVLLGRLLTVLGSFVEAAAETPAAVPLCAGLLELLKAGEVSSHKEAFVRRSALVAASQVVRHLSPARLAGAMVCRQSDAQDQVLVERLQWLMSWAQQVAVSDVDQHCKMLAAGCVAWHVELAEGAMAVLEHLPEPEGPSLVTGGGKGAAGKQGGIDVRLPSVDRLVLS